MAISKTKNLNYFFESIIFFPNEYFSKGFKSKSLLFIISSFFAFFVEKDYIYDISSSKFINLKYKSIENFLTKCCKNKEFYKNGLNMNNEHRVLRNLVTIESPSNNMTSLEGIPDLFNLKSNKIKIFKLLKNLSDFSKEFFYYLDLTK